ncbi:MAG: T9SS type A sorting domain-containing protein [Clostridiaceae bacterium]|nr:T9SS type A sorting domain-containing protein [Clostridiaceae bacterium]
MVWASGKNRRVSGEELHCNFSISQEGEEMLLTSPDTNFQDLLNPVIIPPNTSIGRVNITDTNWLFFEEPTPGAINTSESFSGVLSTPVFSHTPGFYSNDFQLVLTHPDKDVVLHYTLDGSEPTENSPLFDRPLTIRERTSEENRLSNIPTGVGWSAPKNKIAKGIVVRVAAFKPRYISSPPLSGSFFVFPEGGNRYPLPVVSIITDEKDFFCDTMGIYVPGINFVEGNPGSGNYYQQGDEWEREGNFEYFNADGNLGLSQLAGFRIHGGFSRRYPTKALRVYARSSYGESYLNNRFFQEQPYSSYKAILLRPSGNDWDYSLMRDATAQVSVRHLNFDTQAYSPAIVFINGEYWGIKNIREKYDKHYLERVYGVDPENIDLLSGLKNVEEGSSDYYQEMSTYIKENDLSDSVHYARVSTYMDIDNYINYYSAQIYFANDDWPQNNITFWRLRVSYSPNAQTGHDGRFRWMMFDVDRAFGRSNKDTTNLLKHVTDTSSSHSQFILSLLNNSEFKREFINRQADLLNSTFLPQRLISVIDSIAGNIEPVIGEHIRRWNRPSSISNWKNAIENMRTFARKRPHFLRSHIMEYFSLPDTCLMTLLSDPQQGIIKINSLLIDENLQGIRDTVYPWKGVYFKGNPVVLEPVAKPGYKFDYWLKDSVVHKGKFLEIDPDDNLEIKAVFKYDGSEQKVIHYFHFNNIKNNTNIEGEIKSDYSFTSSASIQYQGNGAGYMDDVDGTTENIKMEAPAGKALRVRNPSDTRSLVIDIPTEGFRDIVFSYAVCRTKNGATKQSLYYNTTDDDSSWTLFSSGIMIKVNFETKTFDFSKIEETNNNPFFKVHLTFDENSSELSGNNRFDNVTVSGTLIGDITQQIVHKPIKHEFSLMKINPNPIRDKAYFAFSLSAKSFVTLSIYDMHGRLIATPVNEMRNEGFNEVIWKTENTPAGVYICRIKAGSSQKAKTMIIRSKYK